MSGFGQAHAGNFATPVRRIAIYDENSVTSLKRPGESAKRTFGAPLSVSCNPQTAKPPQPLRRPLAPTSTNTPSTLQKNGSVPSWASCQPPPSTAALPPPVATPIPAASYQPISTLFGSALRTVDTNPRNAYRKPQPADESLPLPAFPGALDADFFLAIPQDPHSAQGAASAAAAPRASLHASLRDSKRFSGMSEATEFEDYPTEFFEGDVVAPPASVDLSPELGSAPAHQQENITSSPISSAPLSSETLPLGAAASATEAPTGAGFTIRSAAALSFSRVADDAAAALEDRRVLTCTGNTSVGVDLDRFTLAGILSEERNDLHVHADPPENAGTVEAPTTCALSLSDLFNS